MNKKNQDTTLFLSFCIELYKTANGMTGKEVMQELNSYMVMKFL